MEKDKGYPRLEKRRLSSLRTHRDGLRTWAPEDEVQLSSSFKHFGLLRVGLVLNVETGTLLDGDLLLEVLRAQGVAEAPVWCVSVPESEEDAAYMALNNHACSWQWEHVSKLLQSQAKRDLAPSLTGFPKHITAPLLAADWTPGAAGTRNLDDKQQEMFG